MKKYLYTFGMIGYLLAFWPSVFGQAQYDESFLFPMPQEKKEAKSGSDATEQSTGSETGSPSDSGATDSEGTEKGGKPGSFSVTGVIDDKKTALDFIPGFINLLLKIVSPIIFVMFVYSGLKFIYAQDNEEEITQAKKFFLYGTIGIAFIALSYSLMKAVYYLLG